MSSWQGGASAQSREMQASYGGWGLQCQVKAIFPLISVIRVPGLDPGMDPRVWQMRGSRGRMSAFANGARAAVFSSNYCGLIQLIVPVHFICWTKSL
jgi:hypothetical protein